MKIAPIPRGRLSVAALLMLVVVPLGVGWYVEHTAYGEARATESVIAPLRAALPAARPAPEPPAQTLLDEEPEEAVARETH